MVWGSYILYLVKGSLVVYTEEKLTVVVAEQVV